MSGIRVLNLRHKEPPNPLSCRWCGIDPRDHAMSWVPGHGWHSWEDPTQQQIHARMRAKRGLT